MSPTTDLVPLPYPEATAAPFVHLDLKSLAEAVAQDLNRRARGILKAVTSNVAQTASSTAGAFGEVTALRVSAVVLERATRVKLTYSGPVSFTGTGPAAIQGQIRHGGSVVDVTTRAANLPTNGNDQLVGIGFVDLPAGTYDFSFWLMPEQTGSAIFRGNIHPGFLIVEDGGPL